MDNPNPNLGADAGGSEDDPKAGSSGGPPSGSRNDHISGEMLCDYAEGALDASVRAQTEVHLSGCAQCRRELEALRAYFQNLSTLEPVKTRPDFLAQVHARLERERSSFGLSRTGSAWEKVLSVLRVFSTPWRFVPGQIALALVFGGVIITAYIHQGGVPLAPPSIPVENAPAPAKSAVDRMDTVPSEARYSEFDKQVEPRRLAKLQKDEQPPSAPNPSPIPPSILAKAKTRSLDAKPSFGKRGESVSGSVTAAQNSPSGIGSGVGSASNAFGGASVSSDEFRSESSNIASNAASTAAPKILAPSVHARASAPAASKPAAVASTPSTPAPPPLSPAPPVPAVAASRKNGSVVAMEATEDEKESEPAPIARKKADTKGAASDEKKSNPAVASVVTVKLAPGKKSSVLLEGLQAMGGSVAPTSRLNSDPKGEVYLLRFPAGMATDLTPYLARYGSVAVSGPALQSPTGKEVSVRLILRP